MTSQRLEPTLVTKAAFIEEMPRDNVKRNYDRVTSLLLSTVPFLQTQIRFLCLQNVSILVEQNDISVLHN